jgi:GAF domain-containing protein
MHSQAGEQQALRMSILYDTSLLISVAATYDEILAGISRHLKAVIPVDHAWLVAFSGQELHLVAASDKNCGVRPAREYFSEAHLRRVADQTENGIFAGKERIALVFDGRPAPPDLGALLVCPLQQGDNPEGYLLIGTGREDGYSRDDILLLFLLGLQLATVCNIRLHNDLMAPIPGSTYF